MSQKFNDSGNIGYNSVQALHSRLARLEYYATLEYYASLEYWIFVYLPFGHSRKILSKNTFSVE